MRLAVLLGAGLAAFFLLRNVAAYSYIDDKGQLWYTDNTGQWKMLPVGSAVPQQPAWCQYFASAGNKSCASWMPSGGI